MENGALNVLSCKYPTTLVVVDDSPEFLQVVVSMLNQNNDVTIKTFIDPEQALKFINDESSMNSLDYTKLTKEGDDSSSTWHSSMINVNGIHNAIYNGDRFAQISTLIVDYNMPNMNGVELCSKIINPNVQKILLTGFDDGKVAIGAFNEGYINRFIKKDYRNFEAELPTCFERSIHRYFKLYTDNIAKHLPNSHRSFLQDPVFSCFFASICADKNYLEYYMLDEFGSYLFLNKDGKCNLLSTLTESELQRIESAGIDSGEIDENVLRRLQSREYILVSHNRNGQLPPISKWGEYLRPARRLDGFQTYYFAFETDNFLDVDFDKIVSFSTYEQLIINKDKVW